MRKHTISRRFCAIIIAVAMMMTMITPSAIAAPSGGVTAIPHESYDTDPEGITIDLFDYWIDGSRDADDSTSMKKESGQGFRADPRANQGINENHVLKFGKDMGNKTNPDQATNNPVDDMNLWKAGASPTVGFVKNVLGTNGYPEISEGKYGGGSLDYLFNATEKDDRKAAFMNTTGLLQVNKEGYYYYDSRKNFASFDENSNEFTLYNQGAVVHHNDPNKDQGQFFPFNTIDQVFDADGHTIKANDSVLNHYFGVHMNANFQQTQGGVSPQDSDTPVTFSFSGDDDVWIFIDDVLVADLGGNHDACSVTIDFEKGQIVVYDDKNSNGKYDADEDKYADTTLKQAYETAGMGSSTEWYGNTFADETYHSFDFFYLERGNYVSNMKLEFNMVTTPDSTLTKVDQDGTGINNVVYDLYKEDGKTLVATGKTGTTGDGELIFETPDQKKLVLSSLEKGNYILREKEVPEGYRSNGDVKLRVEKNPSNGSTIMLVDNPWESGAYAMPKVRVIARTSIEGGNRVVKDVAGKSYNAAEGTLFCVVMKGDNVDYESPNIDAYQAVYGDPLHGWTITNEKGMAGVVEAVKATQAEQKAGVYTFELDPLQCYVTDIENLPGDIEDYYWWNGTDATYTGAYFYSDAEDLSGVNANNTVLLDSSNFERDFAVSLFVPNIQNRLLVQKVNAETGDPLDDASFALYKQEDYDNGGATAVKTCETGETLVDGKQETGFADMTGIPNGNYYLVETEAPADYDKNDALVEVIVDDSGIYINAGEANDNVTASIGVGKIVKSMVQFAVDDGIDATLHDITATLQTADEYIGAGTAWNGTNQTVNLSYGNSDAALEYGVVDGTGSPTLSYDSGWGRLNITQADTSTATLTDKENIQDLGDRSLNNLYSFTKMVTIGDKETGTGTDPGTSSAKAMLNLTKEVTGDGWPDDASFTFTITGKDENGGSAPMPSPETLTVEKPASGNKAEASFGEITFEKAGTYTYTITETQGDVEGMTYDPHTLTATVKVTQKDDGTLTAVVTYSSSDTADTTDEAAQTFTNNYTKPDGGGDDGDDDDDNPPTPPALNTVDHYLYIEGYPENYWTGEESWDESVWPVKPQGNITRAEVATIFYRLLKEDVREDIETTDNDFTDVHVGDWFDVTVSSLANMGVVQGYEDGSFRPNEPITRAELLAIAVRFFDTFEAIYEPGTFTDVEGDEWYATALAAAKELGIVGGYEDGSFRPNASITRAETCAIVNRVLNRHPHEEHLGSVSEMRTWPDNLPGAWYYADMQEATNGHEYEWIKEDGSDFETWTEVLIDWDWTGR